MKLSEEDLKTIRYFLLNLELDFNSLGSQLKNDVMRFAEIFDKDLSNRLFKKFYGIEKRDAK